MSTKITEVSSSPNQLGQTSPSADQPFELTRLFLQNSASTQGPSRSLSQERLHLAFPRSPLSNHEIGELDNDSSSNCSSRGLQGHLEEAYSGLTSIRVSIENTAILSDNDLYQNLAQLKELPMAAKEEVRPSVLFIQSLTKTLNKEKRTQCSEQEKGELLKKILAATEAIATQTEDSEEEFDELAQQDLQLLGLGRMGNSQLEKGLKEDPSPKKELQTAFDIIDKARELNHQEVVDFVLGKADSLLLTLQKAPTLRRQESLMEKLLNSEVVAPPCNNQGNGQEVFLEKVHEVLQRIQETLPENQELEFLKDSGLFNNSKINLHSLKQELEELLNKNPTFFSKEIFSCLLQNLSKIESPDINQNDFILCLKSIRESLTFIIPLISSRLYATPYDLWGRKEVLSPILDACQEALSDPEKLKNSMQTEAKRRGELRKITELQLTLQQHLNSRILTKKEYNALAKALNSITTSLYEDDLLSYINGLIKFENTILEALLSKQTEPFLLDTEEAVNTEQLDDESDIEESDDYKTPEDELTNETLFRSRKSINPTKKSQPPNNPFGLKSNGTLRHEDELTAASARIEQSAREEKTNKYFKIAALSTVTVAGALLSIYYYKDQLPPAFTAAASNLSSNLWSYIPKNLPSLNISGKFHAAQESVYNIAKAVLPSIETVLMAITATAAGAAGIRTAYWVNKKIL